MADGGAIVNVASIEALQPAAGHSHYGAAKAAVVAHTRAAALELGPLGIRVNAVAPGLDRPPGDRREWPEGVARWEAACPLGRLGEPADVADACLFLASDAARWITGAVLVVDGGVLARSDVVTRSGSTDAVTRPVVRKLGPPVTPATSPRPAPRRPASRRTYVVRRIGAGVVAVVVAARSPGSASSRPSARSAARRRDGDRRDGRRDRRRRPTAPPATTVRAPSTTARRRTTCRRRPSAPTPSGATPANVLVVGDSDAAAFAPFLKDQLDATGVAATTVDYKVSSGLARPDFFDWPAHLRRRCPPSTRTSSWSRSAATTPRACPTPTGRTRWSGTTR